jgi:hypothetical protein
VRRGLIIGISAAAAVLVVGGVVAWFLLSRSPGPDATATAYLDALERGDAVAATELLDADVPDAADAFAGADEYLSDPVVDSVSGGDAAEARADVSFTLAGETRTATIALLDTDGGWKVASAGLGSLAVTTTAGDAVGVGKALLTADTAHPLLPGVYPVVAAPVGVLGGSASAMVLPGDAATAAVEASVTDETTSAAQRQLDVYLEGCTQPAAEVPAACGIRIPWEADLTALDGLTYRVEQLPQVVLSDDGRSFAATGGVLTATASGQSRAGGAGEVTYRTDAWSLYGSVTFAGNELTLSVR